MVKRSALFSAINQRTRGAAVSVPPLWAKGSPTISPLDSEGDLMGLGPVQTPMVSQISTNAYAAVAGLLVDLRSTIRADAEFRFSETGGVHGVTIMVQVSLDGTHWADIAVSWQDPQNANSPANPLPIAAGTSAEIAIGKILNGVCGCFYRVVVIDTVGGSHGTLQAQGFAQ